MARASSDFGGRASTLPPYQYLRPFQVPRHGANRPGQAQRKGPVMQSTFFTRLVLSTGALHHIEGKP